MASGEPVIFTLLFGNLVMGLLLLENQLPIHFLLPEPILQRLGIKMGYRMNMVLPDLLLLVMIRPVLKMVMRLQTNHSTYLLNVMVM